MPTNKLWIEHTERAAWQSVQALREKLAEAEQRVERMGPPVEGWQKLFDALDAARAGHALSGESYAELIQSALDRLARAEAERRALEARFRDEPTRLPAEIQAAPVRRRRRTASALVDDDPDFDEPDPSERLLFKEIGRRARELALQRPEPDLDAALGEIETRLAELPELDAGEILDIAADLGALSLRLCVSPSFDDD